MVKQVPVPTLSAQASKKRVKQLKARGFKVKIVKAGKYNLVMYKKIK